MIKVILLFIIVIILLYAIPRINNVSFAKKKKKTKKHREHFVQPIEQTDLTDKHFLEDLEKKMCDPNSQQINAEVINGSGMYVRNARKQLECIPICTVNNSNIVLEKNCIPCGSADNANPGTITQRVTERCVEHIDDMNYSILQPNDTLTELKTCMYDRDYQSCSNCDIIDMDCMFEGPDNSCKRTVHIQPPRGQSRCIMDWSKYANDTADENIKRYAREKDASISDFTEKLDSPHIFKVDCDQCDRDCSLSEFWEQQDCPTNCGSSQSSGRYTKNIQHNFQNDGKNCLSVAMETDYYYEQNEDVEYEVVGNKVEKRIPNECNSTLPCCEVNTDSHYFDWTYVDGTPVGWNGTDTPDSCNTTYKRTRHFDLSKCQNDNDLPYTQENTVTSLPCCNSLDPTHYNTRYDYEYYDLNDNTPINTRSNQPQMSLSKQTVLCQQKVKQIKSFPFNSNVCISSSPKPFLDQELTFENRDICPEDCKLSPTTSLSDCPVCKENARDRIPRQERIWEVTQQQKGSSEDTISCAQAFNNSSDKEPSEQPSTIIRNIKNSTFSTYVKCPTNTKVCCNKYVDDHFTYKETYTKHPINYSNNNPDSPFEIDLTDSTPSSKYEFDNVNDHCNKSIVKTITYGPRPDICTFREGETISNIKPSYSVQRKSDKRCKIDCRLSVSEFTECEEKCGPRKKYRTWTVTESPQYGGDLCSNVFYNIRELTNNQIELNHNEDVTKSGFTNIVGSQFQSEVECDTVIPCCNSRSNNHFISNIVGYARYTPWNSTTYSIYSDASNNLDQGKLLYDEDDMGDFPCNTRMRKIVSNEPDLSVCLVTGGGEQGFTTYTDKVNTTVCAENCEMMLSQELNESDWSECKTNDGNRNNIQCKPGPGPEAIPTKERKWVVTKKNSETGLSCQDVFDFHLDISTSGKEVGETATIPSDVTPNTKFTSYKNCDNLQNCCDPRVDSHWNSNITYKSIYPYDSSDLQDLSVSEGEQFFEIGPPNNTKIKKITTYTRNAANCSHGDNKANDVNERVNTNIDCVLSYNSNWGVCEGNCGLNSIQKRQWSVDVVPQGDGETCSDVLQNHPERLSTNEVPINGYENVPNQGTFETSKGCTHGLPCCEWNSDDHWDNSGDISYRKYGYNATNIPTSEDKLENLTGTGSDSNGIEFTNPPCNTKVVKFEKFTRNMDNCKNGDEDYYVRIDMKAGRETCDCEIDRTPGMWNTSECPTTCVGTGYSTEYMTRDWTIENGTIVGGASCMDVFNTQIRGTETIANEVFVASDGTYVQSKAPCPVDFCQVDCELTVPGTHTGVSDCSDCKQPGEDDGVQRYTWTVFKAPDHSGSNCAEVADNIISTRALGETRGTVSDTKDSTFETTITCPERSICPASGTFSISLTGDDNDIGINSFKFILTDGTNYQNTNYQDNYVLDNDDVIIVDDNELNTVNTERRLINPEDSTFSNRTNIGVSDINGTVVTVSQLVPHTEYKFVLRRKYNQAYGIPPIYTNSLTIQTKPQDCEIEHSDWEDCPATCYIGTPHTQTRTWTVTTAPVGGITCSDKLNEAINTDETINGTLGDELDDEVNTQKNCGTECLPCEYNSQWIYEPPANAGNFENPSCNGGVHRRYQILNKTNCDVSSQDDKNYDERINNDVCPLPCVLSTPVYGTCTNSDGCGSTGTRTETKTVTQARAGNGIGCDDIDSMFEANAVVGTERTRTVNCVTGYAACLPTCTNAHYTNLSMSDADYNGHLDCGQERSRTKNLANCSNTNSLPTQITESRTGDPCPPSPVPCVMSPGTFTTVSGQECPTCGSGTETRTEERTWTILQAPLHGGKNCSVVFHEHISKESNETETISIPNSIGTFNTRRSVACTGLSPCTYIEPVITGISASTSCSEEILLTSQVCRINLNITYNKGNDWTQPMALQLKIFPKDELNPLSAVPVLEAYIHPFDTHYTQLESETYVTSGSGLPTGSYKARLYKHTRTGGNVIMGEWYYFDVCGWDYNRATSNGETIGAHSGERKFANIDGTHHYNLTDETIHFKHIDLIHDSSNTISAKELWNNGAAVVTDQQQFGNRKGAHFGQTPSPCGKRWLVNRNWTINTGANGICLGGPETIDEHLKYNGDECSCDINNPAHYTSSNEYREGKVSTTLTGATTNNSISSEEMSCFLQQTPYYDCDDQSMLNGKYNSGYVLPASVPSDTFDQPLLDENKLIIEKKTYTPINGANCQGGQYQSIYTGKIGPVAPLLQEPDTQFGITENSVQINLWTNPDGNRGNTHTSSLGYHSSDSIVSWKLLKKIGTSGVWEDIKDIPLNAIADSSPNMSGDAYIHNGSLTVQNLESGTTYTVKLRKTISWNGNVKDYDSNEITFTTTAAAGAGSGHVVVGPFPTPAALTQASDVSGPSSASASTTTTLPECNFNIGCCVSQCAPGITECHVTEVEFRLFSHASHSLQKIVTSPFNPSGGGLTLFNSEDGFRMNLSYDDIMDSLPNLGVTNDNYSGRIEIYYKADSTRCDTTQTGEYSWQKRVNFSQSSSGWFNHRL